jgi:Xaa-Pro aminopeptidase
MKISGINKVLSRKEGIALLKKLATKQSPAYTLAPRKRKYYGFYTNRAPFDLAQKLKPAPVEDLRLILAKMRAIKQPLEVKAIQQAIDITIKGIEQVVQQLPNLHYEYEVAALLTYEFQRGGAQGLAFDHIVASGKNSMTIHHLPDKTPLQKNSWLLLDVGARVNGYAADIARTLPLGKPTPRQMEVFDAVARVQGQTIALCQPGMSVADYLKSFERFMGEELVRLGLLKKADDREGVYRWMPHAISHGLGIDVHDSLGKPQTFQEGMVLTVEPGIYSKNDGIGVRIEDDILITKDGPVIMSSSLPTKLF